jgi:hypothetical protein
VAVETASSASGGLGRSAFRAEKRLKSITIMVTGVVERLRAKHVGFSLKISAIKAKIVSRRCKEFVQHGVQLGFCVGIGHLYRNDIKGFVMVANVILGRDRCVFGL